MSMSNEGGSSDLACFLTSVFIVSGFGLMGVFAHAEIISVAAMIMAIFSGLCVYTTIVAYIHLFARGDDSLF